MPAWSTSSRTTISASIRTTEHREHKPGLLGRLFHHGAARPPVDPEIAKIPVLGLLITDGDNEDHRASEIAIQRSAPYPVFWSLVGVGRHAFGFLKQMDREFPDAEFVDLEDLGLSDDMLYAELVSAKLVRWLKQHPPQ
jgi:hypothetical protein